MGSSHPTCKKGDVARIWLYMHGRYGVRLTPNEKTMFTAWSAKDTVSPWESERERRIAEYSYVTNPYVYGVVSKKERSLFLGVIADTWRRHEMERRQESCLALRDGCIVRYPGRLSN